MKRSIARTFSRLVLLAVSAAFGARAQEVALPNPDAQALGMGGTMMTDPAGSHAIYGNSAAAVFSRMPVQVSSSYCRQKGADCYAVTGAYRFGNAHLVQAGWRQYFRAQDCRDAAVDLGYARRIRDRWAIGLVTRYLHIKRPEASADALSADLSAAYRLPLEHVGTYSALRIGAKLGNLGGCLQKTDYTLPMDLTVGAALDTYLSDAHELTVGADLGYCFSPNAVRGLQTALGAEYNLMQLVQLRAGYHYGARRTYALSYWAVGAGLRILHLRLDFAYLFAAKHTALRNTYSIGFGLDF